MIYKDICLHIPSCENTWATKICFVRELFLQISQLKSKKGKLYLFLKQAEFSLSGGFWSCHLWVESRKSCWEQVQLLLRARLHNHNSCALQLQSIMAYRPFIRFCEVGLHSPRYNSRSKPTTEYEGHGRDYQDQILSP